MVDKPWQIERFPIDSSSISSVGYSDGTMVVSFSSGHLYAYQVPQEDFEAFAAAESKGRHYAAKIKGQFAAVKLTGRCGVCGQEPEILGEPCSACGAQMVRQIDTVHKEER